MDTTRRVKTSDAAFRVCNGRLFVNDEAVPVNARVLRIGLAAAGLDVEEACGDLSDEAARRILHMERAYLLAGLREAIRRDGLGRAA